MTPASITPASITPDRQLRHLLTLDGLGAARINELLDAAASMRAHAMGGTALRQVLAGRTVCNLFFENSTRTRSSFQLAAQRLGADVLNFDIGMSSVKKGESPLDTLRTLEAMGIDAFVVRHAENGAVAALADGVRPHTVLINAGDGRAAHPTQGLLDMLTIRQRKGTDFSRLSVLVVGDVRHSRVARSGLHALRTLGCADIRVCGPSALLPEPAILSGCTVGGDLDAMLDGIDVVMMLRLQRERMEEGLVPSLTKYFYDYGLDAKRLALARPDAIVLHPGPINRGVEIAGDVADGPQSVILEQVANGVALRMAVLEQLLAR